MAVENSFVGLPLGLLIAQPIIEVAQGQAALCNVYLDQLFKLAFTNQYKEGEAMQARVVKFKLNRPIVDNKTGQVSTQPIEVEAPLLSLVPIPAFTMDEATVRFTMEVKESTAEKTNVGTETGFNASYSAWGFTASVSGKVTTAKENTRSTDKTAKYEIYARAAQQPPAEGMAKLTTIFASVIEPITIGGGS